MYFLNIYQLVFKVNVEYLITEVLITASGHLLVVDHIVRDHLENHQDHEINTETKGQTHVHLLIVGHEEGPGLLHTSPKVRSTQDLVLGQDLAQDPGLGIRKDQDQTVLIVSTEDLSHKILIQNQSLEKEVKNVLNRLVRKVR